MAVILPSDLDVTAANNTTIPDGSGGTINVAENCPPGNLNDGERSLAAAIAAAAGWLYSGASRPVAVQSGALWVDTSGGATDHALSFYDGTDNIELFSINTTANTVTMSIAHIAAQTFTGVLRGNIDDTNGKSAITVTTTPSAVNYLNVTNSATSNPIEVMPLGTDANIGLDIKNKGTEPVRFFINGMEEAEINSTGLTVTGTITANGVTLGGATIVSDTYAIVSQLTPNIPFDNTTPTSSEGTEILSLSSGAVGASDRVKLDVFVSAAAVTANDTVTVALFRDTTCLMAVPEITLASQAPKALSFHYTDTPGSGTHTYSVRIGAAAGDVHVNRTASLSSGYMGGAIACRLDALVIK